uniref:hypothetical protein n=1 Tax=Nonomuraea bangladeshensis TaxID=404385 RepID=UPI003F4973D4
MKLNPRYDTYTGVVPKFPASVRARLVDVGATLEPEKAARLWGDRNDAAQAYPVARHRCLLPGSRAGGGAGRHWSGALVWSPDMAM